MVCRTKKLLGVKNPAGKKWQVRHKRKHSIVQGLVKNAVEGSSVLLQSISKTLQGAKHKVFKVLKEWLHLDFDLGLDGSLLQRKASRDQQEDRHHDTSNRNSVTDNILPPMSGRDARMQKKTIVLDLDETLVHSSEEPLPHYDFSIRSNIDGEIVTFYVLKRPGVDHLLIELVKNYELVLFTAAVKEYANPVVDEIDPQRSISHRLFRDSCREMSGKFVKDLSLLGRDLKKVIIVDDNPNAYMLQPQNAVPVSSFVDDLSDREIASVISFFKVGADYEDLREAIRHHVVNPLLTPSWDQ
eukprot:Gb_30135 [translate_table: standard]